MSERNSYLEAQKIWDDRYGQLAIGKRNWQVAWMFAALISMVLTLGLVRLSIARKVEYIFIEVDRAGYSSHLKIAKESTEVPDSVVRHELFKLIKRLKTISLDAVVMKENLDIAYKGYIRGAAVSFLNDFFKANDPFDFAKQKLVSVEPISVLRVSEKSWQIRWREVERSKEGYQNRESEWEAHLVTEFERPSSNEDEILEYNPIGLRIVEMSWTKVI